MARCRWLATALPALWSLALALPLPAAEDPRPYLSVKDFGAKGDGAALDARAIQRAIDAAQLLGRALFVPAGVYLINETLRVRPNFRTSGGDNYGQPGDGAHNSSVRILGEGMELSVLQAHPPSPSAPLHSILAFDKAEGGDNSEMQEVSQLFLKAGREPSNATGTPVSGQLGLAMYGIFAPGICRSRFSSIHVYGASEVAVVMEGWCNRIDNCNLESSGSAIRVGDDDNANNVGECSRSLCVCFRRLKMRLHRHHRQHHRGHRWHGDCRGRWHERPHPGQRDRGLVSCLLRSFTSFV